MNLPTMDDLDRGVAEERAAEWQRFLEAGGQPTRAPMVQTRAIGPDDPGETAPSSGVVVVEITDAAPPILPMPQVDPMVWCDVCGRVFQYKTTKAKGAATVQMLRHKRKEHDGRPWDDRGNDPKTRERRARKISRAKKRNWKDPEFRAKTIEAVTATQTDEAHRTLYAEAGRKGGAARRAAQEAPPAEAPADG